jgi:antitoxin VapB
LVQELARITGESLTTAVTEAVRERLERLQREQSKPERIKRLIEMTDGLGALWKEPYKSMNLDDLLYDEETGLPK